MERDKLGREVKGKWDGYETVEDAHEGKMNSNEEYRTTKERRAGGKWDNIMSHFDGLWHDRLGPDGCFKCTDYEHKLYDAFEYIASQSGRTLNDFATIHRDDMKLGDEELKAELCKAKAKAKEWEEKASFMKRQYTGISDSRREYMTAQKQHEERINAFKEHEDELNDAYFDLRVEHATEMGALQAKYDRLSNAKGIHMKTVHVKVKNK